MKSYQMTATLNYKANIAAVSQKCTNFVVKNFHSVSIKDKNDLGWQAFSEWKWGGGVDSNYLIKREVVGSNATASVAALLCCYNLRSRPVHVCNLFF